MFKFICALTLLIAAKVTAQGSFSQRAVLYEGLNQQGEYIVVPQTYEPDLGQQNFDNRARSVCVTGA